VKYKTDATLLGQHLHKTVKKLAAGEEDRVLSYQVASGSR
jgi:hypothetical protein